MNCPQNECNLYMTIKLKTSTNLTVLLDSFNEMVLVESLVHVLIIYVLLNPLSSSLFVNSNFRRSKISKKFISLATVDLEHPYFEVSHKQFTIFHIQLYKKITHHLPFYPSSNLILQRF